MEETLMQVEKYRDYLKKIPEKADDLCRSIVRKDYFDIKNSFGNLYSHVEKARYKLKKISDSLSLYLKAMMDAEENLHLKELLKDGDNRFKLFESELESKVTASVLEDGRVEIIVKDYIPKYKNLQNSDFSYIWFKYIDFALDRIEKTNGSTPFFCKAMVLIDIHMPKPERNQRWDVDNKAYSVIINALRGRLFGDDSCNNLAFSVFGTYDSNVYARINVIDYDVFRSGIKTMGLLL